MPTRTDPLHSLFMQLGDDVVLLTPNRRLAMQLSRQYRSWQAVQQQIQAWAAPQILPFERWVDQLWQQLEASYAGALPQRLNEIQSAHRWLTRLRPPNNTLASPALMATALKQAWDNCQIWQVSPDDSAFQQNTDTQFFSQQCHHVLDPDTLHPSQWQQQLFTYLTELQLPKTVIWAYFDHPNPLHLRWQQTLTQHGVTVEQLAPHYTPSQIQQLAVDDKTAELNQLCAWLQQQQEKGCRQIGVVIPDFEHDRTTLMRQLGQIFDAKQINCSLGKSLANQAMVNQILALLVIQPQQLSLQQAHMLCFSQWLPGDAESRAACFQRLQRYAEPYLSLQQLLNHLGPNHDLALGLKGFFEILSPATMTAREWQDKLDQALVKLGFPGRQSLNSHHFQVLEKWRQAQGTFVSLYSPNQSLSRDTWVSSLQWLTQNISFQPQSDEQASIHCMGLLESLGLSFDALWVMSADNLHFPAPTQPSPFIPLALQRAHGMPRACEDKEQALAYSMIQRLAHSTTGEVIFSYALHDGVQTLGPSPLIVDYPCAPAFAEQQPANNTTAVVMLPNEPAQIPLLGHAPGGANVLQEQARCPFRAFSRHRLGLNTLPDTQLGLTSAQRGHLMHQVLEAFWREVGSQGRLMQILEDNSYQTLLDDCINTGLDYWRKRKPYTMQADFCQREQRRLRTLLESYLPLECNRSPFSIVAIESTQQIELAGLTFTLRIDRIDALDNGDWLVVDYKTGINSISEWFQQPLLSPQLPLYALALPEQVKALILAQLQLRDQRFKGVSAQPIDIKGVVPIEKKVAGDWQKQQASWQLQLQALAQAFGEGEHQPKPHRETLCQQCEYMALCDKSALKYIKISY